VGPLFKKICFGAGHVILSLGAVVLSSRASGEGNGRYDTYSSTYLVKTNEVSITPRGLIAMCEGYSGWALLRLI
jgi:hypothetical protein